MELRRSPGQPYPVGFALAVHDASGIADVNGYYEALGLVGLDGKVLSSLSQAAIVGAYRRRFAVLHPDRGDWDYEAWGRVECAKECLSNPIKKVQYDALRPPHKWRDRLVDKELAEAGADLSKLSPGPVIELPRYCFYYEAGCPLPPYERVLEWLQKVAYAYHLRRMQGPVRVGFTSGEAQVLVRPWGEILMVPVNAEPSVERALEWISSQLCIPAPIATL